MPGQLSDWAQGPVSIDPATVHTVQVGGLGRIDDQGRFQQVFLSMQPFLPEPFPASRSRQAWGKLLNPLHQRWSGGWEPLEMTEPAKSP
jgi:hypothetical protein